MTTQDFTVAHDGRTTSGVKYFPACGRFPVVVFAHGYNGEARDFAPFAEFLAKNGIGAVIFTFSGGSTRDESGFLTTDMTLSTEQEDLVAVMGEAQKMAGAEALFLFGGSQGGFVSALVAEQHGEEIAGLMLLYPAFCIPDDWRRRFCGQEIPETLELWGMTLGKGYFQEACALSPLWYSYKGPVLILHGDEDQIVALSYSEKAAEKYGRAELEVFAGEGHGFSEAGMHRVEGMALSFVRRVLAGR